MRDAVAVVPLRDGRSGKTRLGARLTAPERAHLVTELARHVVTTLLASDAVVRVVVVTGDPAFARRTLDGVRGPVTVLAQPAARRGLNAALDVAREQVVAADPRVRLLVAHADLPALTPDDVAALLGRPGSPLVLAPDRTGSGTNALVLDPASAAFTFRFGAGSLAAHRAEAASRGWAAVEVDRPGTAVDLDTPQDWAALPQPVRDRVAAAVPAMAGPGLGR